MSRAQPSVMTMQKMDNVAQAERADGVILKVEELHKSYQTLEVLKGISLTAHHHDVISLVGSSGSGKSTLLRCLNLLEMPTRGTIVFDGEPLPISAPTASGARKVTSQKALQRIRARMGMVFQSFNLWHHLTVLQNVTQAQILVQKKSKAQAIETAQQLLDRVGISDKQDKYPSQLSGGQQQRAAIARTLALSPDLILFDEPTSALDPEMVGEVLKVMRDLAQEGTTMIVVTHELAFAREVSNHVIFLEGGVIAEQGPPEQVLKNPQSEGCRRFLSKAL